jgi:hypothetical protein
MPRAEPCAALSSRRLRRRDGVTEVHDAVLERLARREPEVRLAREAARVRDLEDARDADGATAVRQGGPFVLRGALAFAEQVVAMESDTSSGAALARRAGVSAKGAPR